MGVHSRLVSAWHGAAGYKSQNFWKTWKNFWKNVEELRPWGVKLPGRGRLEPEEPRALEGKSRENLVVKERKLKINKLTVKLLNRRGGVKRISGLIYGETRGVLKWPPSLRNKFVSPLKFQDFSSKFDVSPPKFKLPFNSASWRIGRDQVY